MQLGTPLSSKHLGQSSNSHLPHLPATEVHKTVDVSELELFVKLKPSEDNPINECVNLDQLLEPCLQPTHSSFCSLYSSLGLHF